MIIPYSTEVLIRKLPISNLILIVVCILSFIILQMGGFSEGVIEQLVLSGWSPVGLIGHQFLHGSIPHLLFNMLYLWVFGNAVCERTGNTGYEALFLLTGVAAGIVHLLFDGHPAIGASGAINGIIGFYLVLYPVNKVNCFYWLIRFGTFQITGIWLIAFWFVVDAWSAVSGAGAGIAYWAHVGGFLSGFGLGCISLGAGWVSMEDYDNPTLIDFLTGKHKRQSGLAYEKQSFSRTPSSPTGKATSVSAPRPQLELRKDINLDCPHCSQNLDVPQEMVGVEFQCPACRKDIQIQEG